MVGSLTDVPDTRMNFGQDGTLAFVVNRTTLTLPEEWTAQLALGSQLEDVYAARLAAVNGATHALTLLFPEPRTIRGLAWMYERDGTGANLTPTAQYSTDALEPYSGTWTLFSAHGGRAQANNPSSNYRSTIAQVNVSGVRAIRLNVAMSGANATWINWRGVHIYGSRPQSIDRLGFWHPTLDTELPGSYFDWGDFPRGNISSSRPFRVKNLSATKTATGMQVVASGMTGADFGAPGLQVAAANDGWSYVSAPQNLAPGATSEIINARLSVEPLLAVGARGGRLHTTMTGYAA